MDNSRQHIGNYLARIPYAVGHEIADDHVVVGVIEANERSIVHMVLNWDESVPAAQIADQVAQTLSRTEQPAGLTVVGYGPEGANRARELAESLQRTVSGSVLPVGVCDGMWRGLNGNWTDEQPIPDRTAELVVAGFPVPAASRADLAASVTPLAAPAFTPLDDATTGHLAGLAPRQRAELAQELLERVAEGRGDETAQMRVLGHLGATDLVTRDVILAHTLDGAIRDDRVEALVRTFRAAPPEQRPVLATLAAAATFFACWHAPKTRSILRHADPLSRLTTLVNAALDAGFDPRKAHDTVRDGAVKGLHLSEQEHAAGLDRTPDRSSPPEAASRVGAERMKPAPASQQRESGPSL